MIEEKRRVFLGTISNKMSQFEQAELDGYLRGYELFRFGFHPRLPQTPSVPMYFSIRQKLMTEEEYQNYLNEVR